MTDYSKLRQELIDKYTESFIKKSRTWQNRIFAKLAEIYFPAIEYTPSGSVKITLKNIQLTNTLVEQAFREVSQEYGNNVVNLFVRDLNRLAAANFGYFNVREFGTVQQILSAEKRVLANMAVKLGVSGNRVLGNSYLGNLFSLTSPMDRVKQELIKAIGSGLNREQFLRNMKLFIGGSRSPRTKREGIIENYMRTTAYDTFAQFDRSVGLEYATALKLKYARYAGGLIETSRPFCKARNMKIFTMEEIMSWKDLDFAGKPTNYDPVRDLGGYNCRHILNWISEQRAKREIAAGLAA